MTTRLGTLLVCSFGLKKYRATKNPKYTKVKNLPTHVKTGVAGFIPITPNPMKLITKEASNNL